MRTIRLCTLLLSLCGLLISCATLTGGNGSETTNGYIIGRLVNPDGSPVAPTQVSLLTWNYNPVKDGAIPDSQIATTGGTGEFSFRAPGKGVFNIEALRKVSGERALIAGISVNENDTTFIPDHAIGKPGAIKIILPPTVDSVHGYVYLPGTTRFAGIKKNNALVDSVPAGFIPAVNYSDRIDTGQNGVVKTNIPVAPGDTTVIADYQTWKNSKKIILNTTTSGADVPGTVTDFPVLIRLYSANFDFSQAKADGGDLRFSKANGSPLPFEIERWDPVAELAEVWVQVDTVHGNDSVQSLIMYWGNGNAATLSNGPAVFDTANGFQAVWHLGEAGNAIAKDATVNHYDGTPSDTSPQEAEGAVGPCKSFNGMSNFIRMNGTANSKLNFSENGIYTISAWAYADTIDYSSHLVFGKSDDQYFMKFKQSLPKDPMVWEFVEYHDKAGWFITNSLPVAPSARTWTYIVGVRNGTSQYFFMNGELIDNTTSVNSSTVPRYTGDDVTIGRFFSTPSDSIEGKCPFLGKIDEVRISNLACNADWIKLCYMNQKQQDALVVIKKQ